jgi:hypothetical protein
MTAIVAFAMQDAKVRKDYCVEISVMFCVLMVENVGAFYQLLGLVDSVIVVRQLQLVTDSKVVKCCICGRSKWPFGFLGNGDTVCHVGEHCEPGNTMAAYLFSL